MKYVLMQLLPLYCWVSIVSLIDSVILLQHCGRAKKGIVYAVLLLVNSLFLGAASLFYYPLLRCVILPLDGVLLGLLFGKHRGRRLLFDAAFSLLLVISDWIVYQAYLLLLLSVQGLSRPNQVMLLVAMVPVKLVFFYLYLLYRRWIDRVLSHSSLVLVIFQFLVLPLFSLLNVIVMQQFSVYYLMPEAVLLIFLDLVFVLVLNVYFQYLLLRLEEGYEMKRRAVQLEEYRRMQYDYYRKLEEKYQGSRRLLHDMKRHLQVLQDAAAKGVETGEYVKDLSGMLQGYQHEAYSDHPIVNIILHEKQDEARVAHIAWECRIGEVDLHFMKDMDITVLLANLLDNALDACRMAEGERYIRLTMEQIQGFLVIALENSSPPHPQIEHTTKEGHEGLGLKNVSLLVEAYGGNLQVESREHEFCVHLYLPEL